MTNCATLYLVQARQQKNGRLLRKMLDRLVASNLFIVELDDMGHWYRYHHLMRDVLRKVLVTRLPEEEVCGLHRRGSMWLGEHGQVAAAIEHALAARDDDLAARMVIDHYDAALREDNWRRVVRWLNLLPECALERPDILVVRAIIERIQFRHQTVLDMMKRAESALEASGEAMGESNRRLLLADIDSLRGSATYWSGDPERALALALRALEGYGGSTPFNAAVSMSQVIFCLAATGRPDAALSFGEQRLQLVQEYDAFLTPRLLQSICAVQMGIGELVAMEPVLKAYGQSALQADQTLAIGWADFGQGYLAYEWNDLRAAQDSFTRIIGNRYALNVKNVADGYVGLCLTLQAQGRSAEAEDTLTEFREFAVAGEYMAYLSIVASLTTRLQLVRQDSAAARPTLPFSGPLNLAFQECPPCTTVEWLVANGSPENLVEAEKVLQVTAQEAARLYNHRRLISIHALHAMVLSAKGEEAKALRALRASLDLAAPGRFLRTYVDLGPRLTPLLRALRDETAYAGYVADILDAFEPQPQVSVADLTNRELDVLERMALRKSNKEIATELYLSPQTVKTHAQNMYRKLGASNRREAVEIARRSGLLA